MMKNSKILIALVATLCIVSSRISAMEVVVDLTQNSEDLNAIVETQAVIGDTVKIQIRENPSTGSIWIIVNRASNETTILTNESLSFVPDHKQEGFTGVGGVKTFSLDAKKVGSETVQLVHGQVWVLNKLFDPTTGAASLEKAHEMKIQSRQILIKVVAVKAPEIPQDLLFLA
ncbi:UNKNOWN [Stylonychia lemnae]|uniref:Proteinase inhibitor I42 chagasin domain-containing protein n=1 Tax=Stylonychia lemnae TaxID=5949 RepID=A0A078BB73_STYLE|nr:UNKNOWN [Stylonychia lemnae]|eukprot:CDW91441.1 UNKNOWN [Stylonychia lemnae]